MRLPLIRARRFFHSEARVFAEALAGLLDEAIMGRLEDYELGVRCFDNLTFGQKIPALETIGNGLLRDDVPPVEVTAVVEGAIAAVFQHLKYEIVYDIDEPECPRPWRKWVVAARQEIDGEHIPPVNCTDTVQRLRSFRDRRSGGTATEI
jgi:hypothetical protein